jgi:hypothetical protein
MPDNIFINKMPLQIAIIYKASYNIVAIFVNKLRK